MVGKILPLFISFMVSLFSFSAVQDGISGDGEDLKVHQTSVLAEQGWTDTGLDVVEGQDVYFKASGMISLQKGNPMAFCGPDGYDLKTVQQPLSDKNIGALIGKVVYLISVEIDEETGEPRFAFADTIHKEWGQDELWEIGGKLAFVGEIQRWLEVW